MPNAAQYRSFASQLDSIRVRLAGEVSKLGPLPTGIVRGGRLQTTVERGLEAAAANVNSSNAGVGAMVRECSFRAAVCATFEANLAQYERDAAQYANAVQSYRNAAAAYDAAVRNAEPGEAVTVSPPGAGPGTPPTRPIPPQYWSA